MEIKNTIDISQNAEFAYNVEQITEKRNQKINRTALIEWGIVVIVLFTAYVLEILKGERSIPYILCFTLILTVPYATTFVLKKKNVKTPIISYSIVIGYALMYFFVLMTGRSAIIFCYILPMLSIIILYHNRHIVLTMGFLALGINIIYIIFQGIEGEITLDNSHIYEIQIAAIILCFSCCYVATILYEQINNDNSNYVRHIKADSLREQDLMLQSISTIANTIDAKDEYTNGHSKRVAEYSYLIAKEMGFDESFAVNIKNIGLLHDIGKIGVPDAVLKKPGKLNDEEFAQIKKHPEYGSKILKDITAIDNLAVGALYHHERYDGRGYPLGLQGESIPLIARIICVADSFDAMNSNRIYRSKLDMNYILEELESNKGLQFDPDAADAMIHLIKSGKVT